MEIRTDSLDLLKNFDKGIFVVTTLALIFDGSRILIGKRAVHDPYIPQLTWTFPGGRPKYNMNLETSLKEEVKRNTSLEINVKSLYYARLFPNRPEILLLYYLAEPVGGSALPSEKYDQIKWVKPTEVVNYFTTPVDDNVLKFLEIMEKNSRSFSNVTTTNNSF